MGGIMKKIWPLFLLGLLLFSSCTRNSDGMTSLRSKWDKLKSLWGNDTEGMLASEGFFGPIEDEFIPLEEEDLQVQLTESAIPQPREIPGAAGSKVPSLNQFHKALGDLSRIFQNVYFNTDDHVLRKPEYSQVIDRISSYMKKHPNMYVSIGGHCDERASEAYNLALGTRRSNYVRSLLVQRGISPERIHAISYGKEKPVDFGHTPSAWSRNRRVEFRIWEK
jgi:peptidoglycan-associated lipoprotein